MSLLKPSRTNYKLVGASLPSQVHNYLTLYSLAKGTSKSKIIKSLLEPWIDEQKQKQDDSVLIEDIIKRAKVRFHIDRVTKKSTAQDFTSALKVELSKKGLSKVYIRRIIQKFERHAKD